MAHAHGHHSAGGIDKLVPIMKMGWDYVSCRVVVSEGRDLGVSVSQGIENGTLTLLQHSLSQYRKDVNQAIIKLRQSEIDHERRDA